MHVGRVRVRVDAVSSAVSRSSSRRFDLGSREPFECQVGERLAVPERERLIQHVDRAGSVALRKSFVPACEQALELADVQLSRLEFEQIAARSRQ